MGEAMTDTPTVLSLKTKIITPRLEETRDWYRDLFGLSVLEEWDEASDKGCILGLGDGRGEAFLEIYASEQVFDFGGLSLQIRVADVGRFPVPDEDRFAHRGPVDRPWGSRYMFFTDPNGVAVIVFSGSSL